MIRTHRHPAEHLRAVPLFADCTNHELEQIDHLITTVPIPAGRKLTTEGQHGREFIVIVEGQATVSVGGDVVATVGPGDFVGEISLLDGGPRTATVVCDTDVVAKIIGYREFSQLLDAAPTLARSLLPGLVARVREADGRAAH